MLRAIAGRTGGPSCRMAGAALRPDRRERNQATTFVTATSTPATRPRVAAASRPRV
jgi:hypothetical protein